MEVSIPINFINQQNVYFVEKKNNIIVEGNFIKVIYSTDSFEMNGVYIAIDIAKNSGFTEEGGRGLIRSASQAVETDTAAPLEFRRQNTLQSANAMFDPNNASPNTEFIQLLKHRMSVYFLNLDEGCDS